MSVTVPKSPHHKKQKTHKMSLTLKSTQDSSSVTLVTPARLLCIYPGAGARKVVTATAAGTSPASWATACAGNGGYTVERMSGDLFYEPRTNRLYKLVSKSAGGWIVTAASGP
jgi:hypothetical protein